MISYKWTDKKTPCSQSKTQPPKTITSCTKAVDKLRVTVAAKPGQSKVGMEARTPSRVCLQIAAPPAVLFQEQAGPMSRGMISMPCSSTIRTSPTWSRAAPGSPSTCSPRSLAAARAHETSTCSTRFSAPKTSRRTRPTPSSFKAYRVSPSSRQALAFPKRAAPSRSLPKTKGGVHQKARSHEMKHLRAAIATVAWQAVATPALPSRAPPKRRTRSLRARIARRKSTRRSNNSRL